MYIEEKIKRGILLLSNNYINPRARGMSFNGFVSKYEESSVKVNDTLIEQELFKTYLRTEDGNKVDVATVILKVSSRLQKDVLEVFISSEMFFREINTMINTKRSIKIYYIPREDLVGITTIPVPRLFTMAS